MTIVLENDLGNYAGHLLLAEDALRFGVILCRAAGICGCHCIIVRIVSRMYHIATIRAFRVARWGLGSLGSF